MAPASSSSPAARRAAAIVRHLATATATELAPATASSLGPSCCLAYVPPESTEPLPAFWPVDLRRLLDGHDLPTRDWLFRVMEESPLFCRELAGRVFASPDFDDSKEAQREATMRRAGYLARRGVFRGWLTEDGADAELRTISLLDCIGVYDHSLAVKIGVHFFLW